MDLSHYFNPVDFSSVRVHDQKHVKYSTGLAIEKSVENYFLSATDKFDIAIFGVPADNGNSRDGSATAPAKIRKELYQLPIADNNLRIVDFGDLKPAKSRKSSLQALRDVVAYFNEIGVVTICIGGSQELTASICEAFQNKKHFSLAVVDALLDIKSGAEVFNSTNFLTRIFKKMPNLFQFSLIAFQNHLVAPALFCKTAGVGQHIRLGRLREDFLEAEPVLRNSDVLSFDLGAVKYSEAPGIKQLNPNGLRNEEACRLAKYAGTGENLKVFGLFEMDFQKDKSGVTQKLCAEMIWYFLEGFSLRIKNNASVEDKKIYRVELKDLNQPLVFYREESTNRWWFEVKSISGEKIILACSEAEYRKASENEIPESWLKYIQKIDEMDKIIQES